MNFSLYLALGWYITRDSYFRQVPNLPRTVLILTGPLLSVCTRASFRPPRMPFVQKEKDKLYSYNYIGIHGVKSPQIGTYLPVIVKWSRC